MAPMVLVCSQNHFDIWHEEEDEEEDQEKEELRKTKTVSGLSLHVVYTCNICPDSS